MENLSTRKQVDDQIDALEEAARITVEMIQWWEHLWGVFLISRSHSFDFEKGHPVGEGLVPDIDVCVVEFGKQFHKVG